jgi:hypothetical protein
MLAPGRAVESPSGDWHPAHRARGLTVARCLRSGTSCEARRCPGLPAGGRGGEGHAQLHGFRDRNLAPSRVI